MHHESEQLSHLRSITYTVGVREAMMNRDQDELATLIRPIVRNQELQTVSVLDVSGMSLFSLTYDFVQNQYVQSFTPTDSLANSSVTQRVLQGRNDALGDKFSEINLTLQGEALFFGGPILDGPNVIGVVLVGTFADDLVGDLFEQSRAGV